MSHLSHVSITEQRIEQYENQKSRESDTLDSSIIKYFHQNGTVPVLSDISDDPNVSDEKHVPCSILESILSAEDLVLSKPLVAQFLMVCSSRCDEDDHFRNELREILLIKLDTHSRNISRLIQDEYLGQGITCLYLYINVRFDKVHRKVC